MLKWWCNHVVSKHGAEQVAYRGVETAEANYSSQSISTCICTSAAAKVTSTSPSPQLAARAPRLVSWREAFPRQRKEETHYERSSLQRVQGQTNSLDRFVDKARAADFSYGRLDAVNESLV